MSETEAETNKAVKPDYVPEKFWDNEVGAVRVEQLINSYASLEKKLSDKQAAVKIDAPSSYDIKIKDELFDSDPALNERLRAKGFTETQAQEVYDLAVDYMLPIILSVTDEYKADREAEKLINHFGGMDKWNETARQLKAYGEKSLSTEALTGLVGSFEGVLALHKMMLNDIGDGVTVRGKAVGASTMTDIWVHQP